MNINIKLTTCKIYDCKKYNANNEKKRLTDKEILLEFSQLKDWFSAKSVIATSICEIMNRRGGQVSIAVIVAPSMSHNIGVVQSAGEFSTKTN